MSRRGRAASSRRPPRHRRDARLIHTPQNERERVLLAVASGTNLQIEVLRRRTLTVAREALELDGADVLELDDEGRLVDEGQGPLQGI